MLLEADLTYIDLKDAIGAYELTVVPRSMFAADGLLHYSHYFAKGTLMSLAVGEATTL